MAVIYKYGDKLIDLDFYKTPATLEFQTTLGEILSVIDLNGEYISGDKKIAEKLVEWKEDNKTDIEDIVWEWECGNDDFPLIENKFTF